MHLALATLLLLSPAALAQTQPAPTGATGICKDGSFTTSATKDGACRGHKGIQTWYNPSIPALPTPTPAAVPSRPAPSMAAATSALPAPTVTPVASLPAPTSKTALASRPAPAPAPSPATRPTPAQASNFPSIPPPQPGQIDVKPGIAAQRASLAAMPQAEGGGPGLVWVNTASKVYHCQGSDFYGKTKSGTYMTEADAKAQGAHPNRNKPCA